MQCNAYYNVFLSIREKIYFIFYHIFYAKLDIRLIKYGTIVRWLGRRDNRTSDLAATDLKNLNQISTLS